MNGLPKLGGLIADPAKVALLPPEAVPEVLAQLEGIRARLWARLTAPQGNGQGQAKEDEDRLLGVQEAAAKLGRSVDSMYRHAGKYPFTVRDGRNLRFSEAGINRYIRQRMGQ